MPKNSFITIGRYNSGDQFNFIDLYKITDDVFIVLARLYWFVNAKFGNKQAPLFTKYGNVITARQPLVKIRFSTVTYIDGKDLVYRPGVQTWCTDLVYRPGVQTWCTDLVYRPGVQTKCTDQGTDQVYRPSVQTWCTDLVYRPGVQTWCTDLVYRPGVQTWCTDLVYRPGVQTWCTDLVYRPGVQTWCTDLVYRPGVQTWCTDLVYSALDGLRPIAISVHAIINYIYVTRLLIYVIQNIP